MRLPKSEHRAQPWRIHEIAPDFELLDVWALPTPGGPDDFPRLMEHAAHVDLGRSSSLVVRMLFAVRQILGTVLGWDAEDAGVGRRVESLRDRLPADLEAGPSGPDFGGGPFSGLYLTDDEYAAELANHTVHGVMHLGWVGDEEGGYRGQMAILVKPNGILGRAYLAAIAPFRYLIVYPQMMRDIDAAWQERPGAPVGSGT